MPDEPEALVKRIDDEVLATLRKAQMSTAYDYAIPRDGGTQRGGCRRSNWPGYEVVSLTSLDRQVSGAGYASSWN